MADPREDRNVGGEATGAIAVGVPFGTGPRGESARRFTLRNEHGVGVRLTDGGATLVGVELPGARGPVDVVLGSADLGRMLAGFPAAGSTIGRVANPIAYARFVLDGVERPGDRFASSTTLRFGSGAGTRS